MKKAKANEDPMLIVEAATVDLTKKGGRGFLVSGGLIITAAHCIECKTDGSMAQSESAMQVIRTKDGTNIQVTTLAVDLVSDWAVLGGLDASSFEQDYEIFYNFCEATTPVPVCLDAQPWNSEFSLRIWTHNKGWIEGKGQFNDPTQKYMVVVAVSPIDSGTSGSAIVNPDGKLIGVVSNSFDEPDQDGWSGSSPYVAKALPVWILDTIRCAETIQNRKVIRSPSTRAKNRAGLRRKPQK